MHARIFQRAALRVVKRNKLNNIHR